MSYPALSNSNIETDADECKLSSAGEARDLCLVLVGIKEHTPGTREVGTHGFVRDIPCLIKEGGRRLMESPLPFSRPLRFH